MVTLIRLSLAFSAVLVACGTPSNDTQPRTAVTTQAIKGAVTEKLGDYTVGVYRAGRLNVQSGSPTVDVHYWYQRKGQSKQITWVTLQGAEALAALRGSPVNLPLEDNSVLATTQVTPAIALTGAATEFEPMSGSPQKYEGFVWKYETVFTGEEGSWSSDDQEAQSLKVLLPDGTVVTAGAGPKAFRIVLTEAQFLSAAESTTGIWVTFGFPSGDEYEMLTQVESRTQNLSLSFPSPTPVEFRGTLRAKDTRLFLDQQQGRSIKSQELDLSAILDVASQAALPKLVSGKKLLARGLLDSVPNGLLKVELLAIDAEQKVKETGILRSADEEGPSVFFISLTPEDPVNDEPFLADFSSAGDPSKSLDRSIEVKGHRFWRIVGVVAASGGHLVLNEYVLVDSFKAL